MEDLSGLLPSDVLANILARLAPRNLAVSHCVCKEWRATADDRCQLRSDLLPITVGGIFIASYETDTPDLFARPSVARRVSGRLESLVPMDQPGDEDYSDIVDSCNGLLLLEDHVVNPATRQWVRLPRRDGLPEGHEGAGYYRSYLAFDPMVSPHYEVISMQHPFNGGELEGNKRFEWPPLVYAMRAYSSRTGRWEERRFALDGIQRNIDGFSVRACGHAAYRRGALYVHCNSHFILRINLSDNRYQVIDLPTDANDESDNLREVYLGKSRNGIHFAAIANDTCRVLVWFLEESNGKMEWVFKHGINQHDLITHFRGKPDAQTDRPWILQDGGSHKRLKLRPTTDVEKNLDWDSDDDERAVDINGHDCDTKRTYGFMIFGFLPYKEILFLHSSRAVAYHFSRSKVQDLGELRFIYPSHMRSTAFVYAPCWVGDL